MRWMENLNHFTLNEKLEIMRQFRIKKLNPGQRVFTHPSENLDSFNIILKGKIGIFYIDN